MPIYDYAVRDVPKFTVSKRLRKPPTQHDPSKEYQFRYRAKRHSTLPHVVKFSGGRSSGMLLFTLLENRILDAGRGDVIVFKIPRPSTLTPTASRRTAARPPSGTAYRSSGSSFRPTRTPAAANGRGFPPTVSPTTNQSHPTTPMVSTGEEKSSRNSCPGKALSQISSRVFARRA